MATKNFHTRDCDVIYGINLEDEFHYQFIREDLYENLTAVFDKGNKHSDFIRILSDDDWVDNDSRNIAIIEYGKFYIRPGIDVQVTTNVTINNGYYSGVNLDYHHQIAITGYEPGYNPKTDPEFSYHQSSDFDKDSVGEIQDYLIKYYKIDIRYIDFIQKFIEKQIEVVELKIKPVFAELATPLVSVSFSNGETIYKAANDPRSFVDVLLENA